MKSTEQIIKESKEQLAQREYRTMKIWMDVMATPRVQTIQEKA